MSVIDLQLGDLQLAMGGLPGRLRQTNFLRIDIQDSIQEALR